jgi:molybdopterin synthase sulfur carrier subunit
MMRINIQFFSQLKEVSGAGDMTLELVEGSTVADLLAQLYQRFPALEKWDANLLIGAGVEFVSRDHLLRPNEEIAIMPPVQGG